MPGSLPPPPIGEPPGSFAWQQWYTLLGNLYSTTGAIPWDSIDTTGSDLTDIATRTHNSLQTIQGGTAGEYYHLTSAHHTALTTAAASYTPTRTGWTDVGSPTVTGRYSKVGTIVQFEVKVIPGTSCATVAGTSYVSLPVTVNVSSLAGSGTMMNQTTLIAIGSCVIDIANSRCYVPTQGAMADTFTIYGLYEV